MTEETELKALLDALEEARIRLGAEVDAMGTVSQDDQQLRLRLLEARILEKLTSWRGLRVH